jgi:hypothetical protein
VNSSTPQRGRGGWPLVGSLLFLFCLLAPPALAQLDIVGIRNSFPGRRIAGGTRGECWSRLFAHLVPANSVFSPGSPRLIGVLEGPAVNPRPLQLELRGLLPDGSPSTKGQLLFRKEFPPLASGVTLLLLPTLAKPVSWSSTYVCPEAEKPSDEHLFFVTSGEPSPLTLLLPSSPTKEDIKAREDLKLLYNACGKTISRQQLGGLFGFSDLEAGYWPNDLLVRCL